MERLEKAIINKLRKEEEEKNRKFGEALKNLSEEELRGIFICP